MVLDSGSGSEISSQKFSDGNSSRPYGTFRHSNLYPGLRPGLSSAVPSGLVHCRLIDGGTYLVADVGATDPEDDIPGDVGGVVGYTLKRPGNDDRVQSLQADLRMAFHYLHELAPGNAIHAINLI